MSAPWTIDEPIPAVCFKEDICRILRVSMRQLEALIKGDKLPLVSLVSLDRRPRFTGASVAAIARGRWAGNEAAQVGEKHSRKRSDRSPAVPREICDEIRGEVRA